MLDTAVNYRHQRSERAIGAALAAAVRGGLDRAGVVVATKGGFLPFDAEVPGDPSAYFQTTYVRPGVIQAGDVVGSHCMTPRYLRDQLDRSRANLGLETLDIYYVHNPETQLDEVSRPHSLARARSVRGAGGGGSRGQAAALRRGHLGRVARRSGRGRVPVAGRAGRRRARGGRSRHRFRVIQLPYNLAMPEAFTRANQKVDGVFGARSRPPAVWMST